MTLYINCCAREESRTNRLARALLESLGGEYQELNLYKEDIKPLTGEALEMRNELLAAGSFDAPEFHYARQFAKADRIVIAAPYWDLSFPSILKVYIENIYVTGIVSRYGADGRPEGLCKADKLYYVTTAGGPYEPRYSFEYIRELATVYLGIGEAELVMAQMLDVEGCCAEEIIGGKIAEL